MTRTLRFKRARYTIGQKDENVKGTRAHHTQRGGQHSRGCTKKPSWHKGINQAARNSSFSAATCSAVWLIHIGEPHTANHTCGIPVTWFLQLPIPTQTTMSSTAFFSAQCKDCFGSRVEKRMSTQHRIVDSLAVHHVKLLIPRHERWRTGIMPEQ